MPNVTTFPKAGIAISVELVLRFVTVLPGSQMQEGSDVFSMALQLEWAELI